MQYRVRPAESQHSFIAAHDKLGLLCHIMYDAVLDRLRREHANIVGNVRSDNR